MTFEKACADIRAAGRLVELLGSPHFSTLQRRTGISPSVDEWAVMLLDVGRDGRSLVTGPTLNKAVRSALKILKENTHA